MQIDDEIYEERDGKNVLVHVQPFKTKISKNFEKADEIAPFAFFGCTLDKERLLMFIQSLPYVEAVEDFSVLRISSKDHTDYHMEETGENNTNQIRGTYPWSILTPMKKHFINVVTKVEEFRDITIGYGDLEVGSTFIIQRRNNG